MMTKDEFAWRVTSMRRSMYRVAASYLRGENDRLDAISEAITRAWEKRWTLRNDDWFETWLTRILIRECVNIQRRQQRLVPVEQIPEKPMNGEDSQTQQLRDALETLPQKQRTMIVLYYMEGYETREIARIMGTTNGAVCSGLKRARDKLRELVEEE